MYLNIKRYKGVFLAFVFICITGLSLAQTTYYSRNGATLPRNWNEADSWTLNSDGSGPAAAIPGRSDNVVILSGHTVIINNLNDNGSAGLSPDDLSDPLVGPFANSAGDCFYQTGELTIEAGGTLDCNQRLMLAGSSFIFGTIDVDGDLINLGDMIMPAGSVFASTDDLIISGTSNTRIDNTNASTFDDLYIDHNQATLCGTGGLAVGVNPNISEVQFLNGSSLNQICSAFTVTGCITCPLTGTGPLPPGPTLTGTGTTINYIENSVVAVDDAVTVTYPSGPFLTNGVFTVSNNYVEGEDVISFTNTIWITGTWDSATGTLTLSGYANEANWEIAFRSITYENSSDDPTASTRTLDFVVSDGFTSSNTLSRDITVNPVNDPPDVNTISGTPTPLDYFEGDGAVAIDDQITVEDPDDTDFESAVITISNFQASEDIIGFTDQNGITGTIVGNTLNLTGTATLAEYQAALRSITFENTSENPNTTTRTVSFSVNDGDASSVPFTRDINIYRVNDGPTITSTAPTSATEDVQYTYTATVNDPDDANDGTQLTWSLSGEPAGMAVSSTGEVTWTPAEGVLTSGAVTLTVADGGENGATSDSEVFTITVTPVNDGPTITSTAPTTATEDVLYTYTPTVNDPDDANDGTNLTWSLSGEPSGMTVSSTGVVTWTPAEGVTTSGSVTLTVADGGEDGATSDSEIFTITVTSVNDGPVITSTAPTTATEDILYTYTPTVNDPDDANDGTQLTWSLSGQPAGMTVSSTGVVTWTPTEGVLTSGAVTLTVADGGENGASSDSEVFTITVTPVNDGPIITSTAPTTATEDILYTYSPTVNDPDDANDGTELTWSLSGEPAGMTVSATGVVNWTPTEGVLTSGAVTLTVADGGEDAATSDSEVFTITVTPVNDGPVITSTAPTTATEDILYTYTPTVNDPDDANDGVELTWSLSGEPIGMTVSATGVVTWTPTEGVLTSGAVTLTVADGGEDGASSDSEVFTITVSPVNDGPIITSTAPATATEDVLYTYTPTVNDPDDANDGTQLTWSLSGEPTGMTVSATGVVTWTPTEGVLTSGTVTLTVADGGEDGAPADSEIFTITVTPVNDGPTITSTAPTTATEDVLYTYTPTVNDPDDANDGVELTWSLAGEPVGMTVSATGVVTWTPTEGVLTSGAVTLTVSDGGEDGASSDSEVFTITVTPVNDGPVITSTAPTTATEDILYTYTPTVNDPDDANDGTQLTWSLSGEPTGMTVSSTGVVTWTPTEGVLTSGTVTLTVADGGEDGATSDSEVFTITVTPVNDGPIITSTAPTTATEDILYTYTPTVNDPDDSNDGTELTWSLSGEPTGMTVSATGVVTWTPAEGVLTSGAVTLTVADGGEDGASSDSEVFTITVTPVNDGPVITSTAPTTATEDVLYAYTPVVDDPDDANDGTNLTWTLSGEPAGMTISATGIVLWTPGEGVLTSGPVTLTVADGGEDGANPDSEIFTITVTPVNDGPLITSTAPTTATEDILYTYTPTVNDPDDANDGVELTWSLSGEPTGMTVSATGVVTWTPTEGVLTSGAVTLTVSDGGEDGAASDSEIFTITVIPVNDGPIITSTAPTTATEDILYTYTPTVNDPDDANDGTELTWSLSGEPAGMIVSATGEVTWTPAEGVLSSGTVTLTVADGGENGASSNSEVFTITVTAVNDGPVITSTAPTTATEDILYTYTTTVNDPDDANDGTELTWSLSGEPAGMTVSPTGVVTWTPTEGVLTSGAVTLTVTDGGEDGANPDSEVFTITVTPVNDDPVVIVDGNPVTSIDITTDEDTPLLVSLTVDDPEGDNVSVDSGVSLDGSGTISPDTDPTSFLYTPAADFFGNETLEVTLCDDGTPSRCITLTVNATVNPVNDPPILDSPVNTLDYNEGDGAIAINNQLTITDIDDTDIEGGTIVISSNYQASEDFLAFTDQNGITGTVSGNTLTLSGTSSLANYEAAIRSITYENTSGAPDTNPRTVDFTVSDGDDSSNTFSVTININSIIETPVLTGAGGILDYTEGDGAVIIDNSVSATDADDTNFDSASISISSNYAQGEDFLAFVDQSGITGFFDNSTGTLTLSGSSSIANYITALQSITYENTSLDPSTALRTVSFTVNDGDINSNTVTRDINVIPVNSAPIAVDDTFSGEEDADTPVTGNILVNDADPEGDNLVLNTTPISGPSNGSLVINMDGSIEYTPNQDYFGTDSFVYEICDDGNPSLCAQATVTLNITEVIDVKVFQAVSPNNDGMNDSWKIQDIQKFPTNLVRLYDRWNVLVYEMSGYDNDNNPWVGQSNNGLGSAELPNGTYFYTIDLGDGSELLKGFIVLKR